MKAIESFGKSGKTFIAHDSIIAACIIAAGDENFDEKWRWWDRRRLAFFSNGPPDGDFPTFSLSLSCHLRLNAPSIQLMATLVEGFVLKQTLGVAWAKGYEKKFRSLNPEIIYFWPTF